MPHAKSKDRLQLASADAFAIAESISDLGRMLDRFFAVHGEELYSQLEAAWPDAARFGGSAAAPVASLAQAWQGPDYSDRRFGSPQEWIVVDSSRRNSVFASEADRRPRGYVLRSEAEHVLGRDLGGAVWFSEADSAALRACRSWTESEPGSGVRRPE